MQVTNTVLVDTTYHMRWLQCPQELACLLIIRMGWEGNVVYWTFQWQLLSSHGLDFARLWQNMLLKKEKKKHISIWVSPSNITWIVCAGNIRWPRLRCKKLWFVEPRKKWLILLGNWSQRCKPRFVDSQTDHAILPDDLVSTIMFNTSALVIEFVFI